MCYDQIKTFCHLPVFWIHDRGGHAKGIIDANGGRAVHVTTLASEWWVRDARTDTLEGAPGRWKMTDGTCLYNVKILSDEHRREYVIPKRLCYDLSGHCPFWNRSGKECDKNPNFMHQWCRKECRRCTPDVDPKANEKKHDGTDYPGSDEL